MVVKNLEEELKKIPGFSQGVRDNSALRMVKLARPICPNSKVEMEQDARGNYHPVDKGPEAQNCQMAGGKWWILCEELGHNPYYSTRTWTSKVPVWEEIDGETVMTSERVVLHKAEYPNITQVPVVVRIHQGRGAINSIERKGRKRLKDIGYAEVCQFRNCQKNVAVTSTTYGGYCSQDHLTLVAADQQGVLLTSVGTGVDLGNEAQSASKRQKQLREAGLGT